MEIDVGSSGRDKPPARLAEDLDKAQEPSSVLSASSREKCVGKHRGMPGRLAEMKAICGLMSSEAFGSL